MDWTTLTPDFGCHQPPQQHSDSPAADRFELDFSFDEFYPDYFSRDPSSEDAFSESGSLEVLSEEQFEIPQTQAQPITAARALVPEPSGTFTKTPRLPLCAAAAAANPERRPELEGLCLLKLLHLQTTLSKDMQESPSHLERAKVQNRQLKRKMRQIRKKLDTMSPTKCKKELGL